MCLRHYFLMGCPGLFCFWSFQAFIQYIQQKNVRPSSVQCRDLNSRPPQHKTRAPCVDVMTSHHTLKIQLCWFKCMRQTSVDLNVGELNEVYPV